MRRHGNRFQIGQQRRAGVPGHPVTRLHHVVPLERRHRNRLNRDQPQVGGESLIGTHDLFKHGPIPGNEIHLVHGDHDVLHAEHGNDAAMPAGLRQDTLARIDQQDG